MQKKSMILIVSDEETFREEVAVSKVMDSLYTAEPCLRFGAVSLSPVSPSMSSDRSAARSRGAAWFLAFLLLSLCLLGASLAKGATFQPLEIVTQSGPCRFSVEIATTEQEMEIGLMYREELADGTGMLFEFSPEQEVSMWMKNTYISLDMIFIRLDGRILRIAENAEPSSTRIIPSMGLARAVLELPAGTAQKYGILPGDRVKYPWFNGK